MDGIPQIPGRRKFTNKDGYSNIWTDHYYFYDPPPTCNKFTLDCKSKWLECDTKRIIDRLFWGSLHWGPYGNIFFAVV
jgi:hypothetical protein